MTVAQNLPTSHRGWATEGAYTDMQYTEEQHSVAADRSPRLLVRALAGTGKTETVALRIQSLIDGGTKPEAIQTLCFTGSARDQLRNRLNSRGLHAVSVSTVHAAAWRILDQWCEVNGHTMPRVVSGEVIAKNALTILGISPSDSNANGLLRLSNAGWNSSFDGVALGDMTVEEMLESVRLYRHLKLKQAVCDFDDLAALAGEVAVRSREEVIVDEAQDLSAVQIRMVEAVCQDRMTWVGDSNQSIFSFAGVDGGMFDRLHGWQELTLSRSFRSTEEILSMANQLSKDVLHSSRYGGTVTVEQVDYEAVGAHIVKRTAVGSHAVIGRTRIGLERIAHSLEQSGLIVQRSWEPEVVGAEVTVSTVHKAKGGEWDTVTVVDVTGSGFADCDVNEEEKRLFYVAVTRAKQTLNLITLDGDLPWNLQM